MAVSAIVGANWGDEGKGKLTDFLAADAAYVVRFQGGNNAGHTIINKYGKFALHLLPSGIFNEGVINVLGPGVAVNCNALLKELEEVKKAGGPEPSLAISDRAQAILPYHIDFDRFEEERRGKESFGSTQSGIAPFYSDKFLKIGVQINELFDDELLEKRLNQAFIQKNVMLKYLYQKEELSASKTIEEIQGFRHKIKPYVTDTTLLLREAIKKNENILLEGQLGALRDPEHGIYPFSTSSPPISGYAPVGAGIPARCLERVVTVTKAYSTCVGAGPFVSEFFGDEAEELRQRGGDAGEYGATTGRPRRVGWFDCVATRYGLEVQGATETAVTNLDVLGYLDEIKVCVAYRLDGEIIDRFPVTRLLDKCEPVFKALPGWKKQINTIRKYEELPEEARNYIEFIEKHTGVPVKWVSVGPKRDETIIRE